MGIEVKDVAMLESEQSAIPKGDVAIVYFTAPFSVPCKQLRPKLEKYQAEIGARLRILMVDVTNVELEWMCQTIGIVKLPTFHVIKNGKLEGDLIGGGDEGIRQIQATIGKLLGT